MQGLQRERLQPLAEGVPHLRRRGLDLPVKSAHIPKIERRLALAVEVLLPESTVRGEVMSPEVRLRKLLARLDSAEFEGKGRPESGWRQAALNITQLLTVDVPELIDAVREAQGAQRKYCRYCGERRLGLLAASHDDNHSWECRDEDGCDARAERKEQKEREMLSVQPDDGAAPDSAGESDSQGMLAAP